MLQQPFQKIFLEHLLAYLTIFFKVSSSFVDPEATGPTQKTSVIVSTVVELVIEKAVNIDIIVIRS